MPRESLVCIFACEDIRLKILKEGFKMAQKDHKVQSEFFEN